MDQNGETRVPDARQNGEAREQVEDQENGAKSEPNGSNGAHENGNSDRILSVESGGEEETSHLSEPDSDSEAPKSPDLPSPPSPLERPNRAPSASSFRSKKAFFEELGPFKVREPSAKGRRKANNNNGAQQEDEEEKSNSSSVSSGVPGPAE